jgi:hypothetical protein
MHLQTLSPNGELSFTTSGNTFVRFESFTFLSDDILMRLTEVDIKREMPGHESSEI